MIENHLKVWKRRSGFTLIELLVVIAIIGILASLLMVGVIVFLRKGPEAQTRNDILQLSRALQSFKSKYGQYPPSFIRLRSNLDDYRSKRVDALDDASVSFLRSIMWKNLPQITNIPWAGSTPLPPGGIVLEGDQCLLFFLCGPPNQGGNAGAGLMGGFTDDPVNPVGATNSPIRFMDPPNEGRLVIRNNVPGQLFPSYLDAYGTLPYMYFSSTGNVVTNAAGAGSYAYSTNGYQRSANSLGITPYYKSQWQFFNPDSFQLISAGLDGSTPKGGFGPGGLGALGSATGIGADDMSNFHDKLLGIP